MLPRLPKHEFVNALLGNMKFICKVDLSFAGLNSLPYLIDLRFGELGCNVFRSLASSVFAGCICHVIGKRARDKVCWVYAPWVVAGVHDNLAFG